MVYILYILPLIAFVVRAPTADLWEGQELVSPLPLPAEDGVQGSPGREMGQPSFI